MPLYTTFPPACPYNTALDSQATVLYEMQNRLDARGEAEMSGMAAEVPKPGGKPDRARRE